ncbi:Gfo/Idh/MocA family oxidoreductase [uncultured Erythrobacter sp.]|uniref:Gfo/Idh/MocA family protein n=1 Tax=uncultured Erythrobacter sp. TaxID=263913 RepID=UPI00261D89D3|nr:Gfo/Idh/MocA family oxidoreductase [uncultured Erythrobacter sp.]
MTAFRWGIWGTGDVARKFALGLGAVEGASLAWTLSRDQSRADAFAQRIGAPVGFSSLEDAAATGADAVYIATPAHAHADNAVAALEAGIPVLVEKPFASSFADAQRIVDAARERKVFAMEAMWTRFQPNVIEAAKLIASGAIGTPRLLRGEVCIATKPGGSLYDPNGGGALRQRGIYPLSLAAHFLGFPDKSSAIIRRGQSGADEETGVQLRHPGGAISQIRASLTTTAPNSLEILGDKGSLRFEGRIWRPSALHLKQYKARGEGGSPGKLADLRETGLGQSAQRILMPLMDRKGRRRISAASRSNGYGYQAEEVMARIVAGDLESPRMPLSESLALTELMDRLLDERDAS